MENIWRKWVSVFPRCRSHARGMDNKDFWMVYHEHLEMVAGLAGKAVLVSQHVIIMAFIYP